MTVLIIRVGDILRAVRWAKEHAYADFVTIAARCSGLQESIRRIRKIR